MASRRSQGSNARAIRKSAIRSVRSGTKLLKDCMIFSPHRSIFGGPCTVAIPSRRAFRLIAGLLMTGVLAAATAPRSAAAQTNFDRPGSDYHSSLVPSGDPAECAMGCERDRRCRAWSFNYPTDPAGGAVCWLKSAVPARIQNSCCVSGVRGAGVIEPRNSAEEISIDRLGGDYRNFDIKGGDGDDACKTACVGDNKCRAWTFARAGYVGKEAHCFLKKDIKPPRRKAGFTSGVVR
jgi:hypothetical protein